VTVRQGWLTAGALWALAIGLLITYLQLTAPQPTHTAPIPQYAPPVLAIG
jgi:hypothetical protein